MCRLPPSLIHSSPGVITRSHLAQLHLCTGQVVTDYINTSIQSYVNLC